MYNLSIIAETSFAHTAAITYLKEAKLVAMYNHKNRRKGLKLKLKLIIKLNKTYLLPSPLFEGSFLPPPSCF